VNLSDHLGGFGCEVGKDSDLCHGALCHAVNSTLTG
jgi:hypothetical protein